MRTPIFRLLVLACSALAPFGIAKAQNKQHILHEETVWRDPFGESLKKFLSRHQEAKCHVRPAEEGEESRRAKRLGWVDCGLARAIEFPIIEKMIVYGHTFIADHGTIHILGTFATFHDDKLVEIGYTIDAKSIDTTLQMMYGDGEPTRSSFKEGKFQSATWVSPDPALKQQVAQTVEIVSLPPVTADGQFLRIGKGTPTRAVQIRARLLDKGEPTSGF